jgi:hypothetical protein
VKRHSNTKDVLTLPEQGEGKLLAVGLLLIPVITVYLFIHYTLMLPHAEMNENLSQAMMTYQKLHQLQAQKSELRTALSQWENAQQGHAESFFHQASYDLAAANLQSTIKDVVWSQDTSNQNCRLQSQQNVPLAMERNIVPVAVKVTLQCKLAELQNVIYDLENLKSPLLIIESIMITQQLSQLNSELMLGVQMTVLGYWQSGDKPKKLK